MKMGLLHGARQLAWNSPTCSDFSMTCTENFQTSEARLNLNKYPDSRPFASICLAIFGFVAGTGLPATAKLTAVVAVDDHLSPRHQPYLYWILAGCWETLPQHKMGR